MECIDKCTWMPMTIRWQQGHPLRKFKKKMKSGGFDSRFDYRYANKAKGSITLLEPNVYNS